MINKYDASPLVRLDMPSMVNDVREFHAKFGLLYEGEPRLFPQDLDMFRSTFLLEEMLEYMRAKTKAQKFDALLDLIYVAIGNMVLHGFPIEEGWALVHNANMTKIRGSSYRDLTGGFDVVKPTDFIPPNHSSLVGE